jgi:hypothetical protein
MRVLLCSAVTAMLRQAAVYRVVYNGGCAEADFLLDPAEASYTIDIKSYKA